MGEKRRGGRGFGHCLWVVLWLALAAFSAACLADVRRVQPAALLTGMPTVAVDAGHGGVDSGAVGADGTEEADVNFAIALLLKTELERLGCRVVLTRQSAEGIMVNGENISRSKQADMRMRQQLLREAGADLVISIHQNAYPDESCRGAQVFYQKGSEAEAWAERVQTALQGVQPENRRKPQQGDYFLRAAQVPAILVECGFMTNGAELALLKQPAYRQKLARAVAEGTALWWREG